MNEYMQRGLDRSRWKEFCRLWQTVALCEGVKLDLLVLVESNDGAARAKNAHSIAAVIGSMWWSGM